MSEIRFYGKVPDELLKFAVIAARADGKWIFCKHRERDTLEIPGGHREPGETILDAAKRELHEETGAVEYSLFPVSVYSARDAATREESFGMLYFAEVRKLEPELHSEIERTFLLDGPPEKWTYPAIQPELYHRIQEWEKPKEDLYEAGRGAADTFGASEKNRKFTATDPGQRQGSGK